MQTTKTANNSADYSQVFENDIEEKQQYFCTYALKVSPVQTGPYVSKYFDLLTMVPVKGADCSEEEMLPADACDICRLNDGSIRSFMVDGVEHFTEKGRQWWTAIDAQHQLAVYGKVGYTYEEQAVKAAETQDEYCYYESFSYSNDNWDYTAIK